MKSFKNILCVINPDKDWEVSLNQAIDLAKDNQANLTVINIAPIQRAKVGLSAAGNISAEVECQLLEEYTNKLIQTIEPYKEKYKIDAQTLSGISFIEIIQQVLRHQHDLVIKSVESPDWLDQFFGSEDMHLLRKCPCPVWLLNPNNKSGSGRILAAVDVEHYENEEEHEQELILNTQILEIAASIAIAESSELHVASVWYPLGEDLMNLSMSSKTEQEIEKYADQYKQSVNDSLDDLIDLSMNQLGDGAVDYIEPKLHLVKGSARKEIPALAKKLNCDLIVMGTVGRTGIPGFIIGNTAETILNQIKCSVLAIKPPGFETPVTLS